MEAITDPYTDFYIFSQCRKICLLSILCSHPVSKMQYQLFLRQADLIADRPADHYNTF